MGRPHPMALRDRVVAFVEVGNGHREAARHVLVSPKFVDDMVRLKRETGGLAPKPQGSRGRGKLTGVADRVRRRVGGKGDITLDDLVVELSGHHGLTVHRSSVGRLLHRLGLSREESPSG